MIVLSEFEDTFDGLPEAELRCDGRVVRFDQWVTHVRQPPDYLALGFHFLPVDGGIRDCVMHVPAQLH